MDPRAIVRLEGLGQQGLIIPKELKPTARWQSVLCKTEKIVNS
jgi:hypothetical protein